jgi:hypothetical protein
MTEPAYGCDRCGRPATVISVLPGLHRPPKVARITCGTHTPRRTGVYRFPLEHYHQGPYSLRQHLLDVKTQGARAVALVDTALELARRAA